MNITFPKKIQRCKAFTFKNALLVQSTGKFSSVRWNLIKKTYPTFVLLHLFFKISRRDFQIKKKILWFLKTLMNLFKTKNDSLPY